MKIIFLFLILTSAAFSQTDWERWGKSNYSYQVKDNYLQRSYSLRGDNVTQVLVNSFTSAYWFFISDVDGNNCPFRPTCSSFFVASVKKTNLIQGTLMFFDRFTRDMDFVNRSYRYPEIQDGHLYDPVSLYELDTTKINYIPPATTVIE